jgi:putative phosphoesterase
VAQHDEVLAKKIRAKYGSGASLALENLSKEQIKQLRELPETAEIALDGVTFLLCHGSPWDTNEYIYPDADETTLRACASQGADFVLLGHTHYPLMYTYKGKVVLNPGSVGQPRDIGNMASWAIIDTANRSVIQKRTMFDTAPILQEAQRRDPAVPYLVDVLRRKKI